MFEHDGLAASEGDVGRGEIVQALVIAPLIIMLDEASDVSFEIGGQAVVFEQNAVLERLMPGDDGARRECVLFHDLLAIPRCY
jgi:hypothetical protein